MTLLSEQRKKQFWESKILNWEDKRYFKQRCNSLLARREIALEEIQKIAKGKSIIELGCGSAYLANRLFESGATQYTGYDFSSNAIKNAWKTIDKKYHSQVKLEVLNLVDLKTPLGADIVFSLGLLDWITAPQIIKLHQSCKQIPYFMHSFTKKSKSLKLIAHKAFVLVSYGLYNKLYTPNYYSPNDIKTYFNNEDLFLIEENSLGIGALIKNWQ